MTGERAIGASGSIGDTADTNRIASADLEVLVEQAVAGQRGAWDILVDRFSGLVWAVARSHGLCPQDAADVSQTTWLRLIEHLDRIQKPNSVGAWLATTARRESLRVIRSGKRQIPAPQESFDSHPDDSIGALVNLVAAEREAALAQAFALMPPRCQSILWFLLGDPEMSYRELASSLGMPVGSIGPTRGRCLAHLRRLLDEIGASAPARLGAAAHPPPQPDPVQPPTSVPA
jgi:RNA polymerase sigma factor (sigma-70 family)